jgi:hypothetical protein
MKFPREIMIKILSFKNFNFRKEWLEDNLVFPHKDDNYIVVVKGYAISGDSVTYQDGYGRCTWQFCF